MTATTTLDRLTSSKDRALAATIIAAARADLPMVVASAPGDFPELHFDSYDDAAEWAEYGLIAITSDTADMWALGGRSFAIGHLRTSPLPWNCVLSWPLVLPQRTPGAGPGETPEVVHVVVEGVRFTEPASVTA